MESKPPKLGGPSDAGFPANKRPSRVAPTRLLELVEYHLFRGNSLQEQIVKIYAPGKRFDPRPLIFPMRPDIVPANRFARHTERRHPRCIVIAANRPAGAHIRKHRSS